jgi:hypothetical protein
MGFETEMRQVPKKYKKRGEWLDLEIYLGQQTKLNRKKHMLLKYKWRRDGDIYIDNFVKSQQIKNIQSD